MSVGIVVSSLLRKFTNGQELVEVRGQSAIECLHNLEVRLPSTRQWLYDKQGDLLPQVSSLAQLMQLCAKKSINYGT